MISVIIPVYNEESYITATIKQLWENDEDNLMKEIIIVDGGSTDKTTEKAKSEGVTVVSSLKKGRAAQMNYGASLANGEILYFLHADTIPPKGFSNDILTAFNKGYSAGCYRLSFDHDHWFLKANCWVTRYNVDFIRFGDQSLFVTKSKFVEVGGFCEKHIVLEDQDIIKRLKKIARFTVIKKPVLTSARKYLENGIYKTQGIFFIIYFMYRLGFSQQKLLATYRKLIRQDKL
jgi:rSAM/selenodomain-associated transferase 2